MSQAGRYTQNPCSRHFRTVDGCVVVQNVSRYEPMCTLRSYEMPLAKGYDRAKRFRRNMGTKPSRPDPNKISVPGSGTVEVLPSLIVPLSPVLSEQ